MVLLVTVPQYGYWSLCFWHVLFAYWHFSFIISPYLSHSVESILWYCIYYELNISNIPKLVIGSTSLHYDHPEGLVSLTPTVLNLFRQIVEYNLQHSWAWWSQEANWLQGIQKPKHQLACHLKGVVFPAHLHLN